MQAASVRSTFALLALSAAFASGCGLRATAPGVPALLSLGANASHGALTSDIRQRQVGSLYVASHGSKIYAFAPGTTKPKLTITVGVNNPNGLLFDSKNNLYVSNAGPGSAGSVTEYAPGQTAPIRTITKGINQPTMGSMAAPPDGTLIVASQAGISEYHPGETKPFFNRPSPASAVVIASPTTIDVSLRPVVANFTIGQKKWNFAMSDTMIPGPLAIDASGTLYVVDSCGPGCPVREYDPSGDLIRTLGNGIDIPVGVLVDPANNAWVNNYGEISPSISAFHPNHASPFFSLTNGLNSATSIAVDGAETLYVGNTGGNKFVKEYANGSHTPTLKFPLPHNEIPTALVIAPPGL